MKKPKLTIETGEVNLADWPSPDIIMGKPINIKVTLTYEEEIQSSEKDYTTLQDRTTSAWITLALRDGVLKVL